MAKLITVYWRDIPAQIIAKQGRKSVKEVLPQRFAEAIDRAAMRAGKGSSDAYLSEWRRVSEPLQGDMQEAVREAAQKLDNAFDDEQLLQLIRAKGVASDTSPGDTPPSNTPPAEES
ncbi:virulence factor [Porticoccus sp. W117]|uniref:virulence factor n=1 Tax=Porticoccus sp. W117 TaxID=3054777 RepID=UPI00259AB925|nr:virulence factor [Porticoccus sp. W117]MDM3871393.1 virulence factor [Porticoccus sp. W117]